MNEAPDPEELARQGIEMLDAERGARAATTARHFLQAEGASRLLGRKDSSSASD